MARTELGLKTVVGLFDNLSDARDAVSELVDAGLDRNEVNLVANASAEEYSRYFDQSGKYVTTTTETETSGAAAGAGIGAVLGGLGGLLVGMSLLPIPGIGPVVAAGPIGSALATAAVGAGVGALAGGLIGALTDIGVPEEHAGYYTEGVRRGGSLVVVKTEATRLPRVTEILNRHNPIDVEQRVSSWRQSGWKGYDKSAKPYTVDDIAAERQSYADVNRTGWSSRAF